LTHFGTLILQSPASAHFSASFSTEYAASYSLDMRVVRRGKRGAGDDRSALGMAGTGVAARTLAIGASSAGFVRARLKVVSGKSGLAAVS